MATSRDVAHAAGVSQATVSRVLTGDAAVRESTRARVLAAIDEVGYTPNVAAQSMRTGRSNTIGVVVADLDNPFYPQLLSALSRELARLERRTSVWVSAGDMNAAALQAIRQGTVDGVVFTTVTEGSAELRDALERKSPVVLVNRTLPEAPCDQVASDNARGSALVADYFVAHGRRRPAFISGPLATSTSRERLDGYSARLASAGVALPGTHTIHGEYTRQSGYRSMLRLLDEHDRPDAVFCSNDILAFGAIDAARMRGLRVPEDVWVVGYDDVDMASWEAFDLTTVRQDTQQLAAEAARMLVQRIDARDRPPERVVLEPLLIVRGSTAHTSDG